MRFWPFWSQREAHPLTFYLREQKRGRRERYKCGSNERDGKTKVKGGGRDLVGASCGNGGPKTNSMHEFKCFL